MAQEAPCLSVILLTPNTFAALRRVVGHLRAQDGRDRIEIVIVSPSVAGLDPDPAVLEGFHSVRLVEMQPFEAAGHAVAMGIREAQGAVVVYVEEHSFPARDWASALIRAHEGPWAAVGPAMTNANPETFRSWTSFLLDFAPWLAPVEAGPAAMLPAHQTSYKRDILLSYGENLGEMLETETTLQHDLGARGHELYLESAAVTDHVNVSRLSGIVVGQFHNLRTYAGNRARDGRWSRSRSLVYMVGSPLLPLVRGARVFGQLRRRGLARTIVPRLLPSLMVGLAAGALGEMFGYAFGPGDSPRHRMAFELDRLRFVTPEDRRRILSEKA